jgi:hypothetical protein
MSGFPRLFLFYRVFGCFSAMRVQKHHKKRCAKTSCRKVLSKKSGKKIQSRFFSIFLHHAFERFSVRGVQKHDFKKNTGKKSDPGPFLASDPPTHHGGHRFVFNRPLPAPWAAAGAGAGIVRVAVAGGQRQG